MQIDSATRAHGTIASATAAAIRSTQSMTDRCGQIHANLIGIGLLADGDPDLQERALNASVRVNMIASALQSLTEAINEL